jgi:hypothetical protein
MTTKRSGSKQKKGKKGRKGSRLPPPPGSDPPVIIDGGSVNIKSASKFGNQTGPDGDHQRTFPRNYGYIRAVEVDYTSPNGPVPPVIYTDADFSTDCSVKIYVRDSTGNDVGEFTFDSAGAVMQYDLGMSRGNGNAKRPYKLLITGDVELYSWELSSNDNGFNASGGLDDPAGYSDWRMQVWFS